MRNPNLMSIPDVAYAVDKSIETIRRFVRQGTGPAITRIGKTPYVTRGDFEAWLRSNRRTA
jgi:hypothetical protein